MEKEKFVAMGLSDELLEKVSGGYPLEGGEADDEESWLIYHLSPGGSCYDNVLPIYNGRIDRSSRVCRRNSAFAAEKMCRRQLFEKIQFVIFCQTGSWGVRLQTVML